MGRWIRDLARSGLSLVVALMICVSLLPAEAFAVNRETDNIDITEESTAAQPAGGRLRMAVRSASECEWGPAGGDAAVSDGDGVRTWDVSGTAIRYLQVPVSINVSGNYGKGGVRIELPLVPQGAARTDGAARCSARAGTADGWTTRIVGDSVVMTNDVAITSAMHRSLEVYYTFDCWNMRSGDVFAVPCSVSKNGAAENAYVLRGRILTGYGVELANRGNSCAFSGFGGTEKDSAYIRQWNPVYEKYFGLTEEAFEADSGDYAYDIAAFQVRPKGQQPYDVSVGFIPGQYPTDEAPGLAPIGNEGELVGAAYMLDPFGKPGEAYCRIDMSGVAHEYMEYGNLPHAAAGGNAVGTWNRYDFTIRNEDLPKLGSDGHPAAVSGNLSDATDSKTYALYLLVRYPKDNVRKGTSGGTSGGVLMSGNLLLAHRGIDSDGGQDAAAEALACRLYAAAEDFDSGNGDGIYAAWYTAKSVSSRTGLSSLLSGQPGVLDFSADFLCLNEKRADFNQDADPAFLNYRRMEAIVDLSFLSGVSDSGVGETLLGEGDYRLAAYRLSLVDAEGNWSVNSDGSLNVGWEEFKPPKWADDAYVYVYGSASLAGDDWKLLDRVRASDIWAINSERNFVTGDKRIDSEDQPVVRLKAVYDSRLTAMLRVGYQIELLPGGPNVSKAVKRAGSSGADSLGLTAWFDYIAYSYTGPRHPGPDSYDGAAADLSFPYGQIIGPDGDGTGTLVRDYDRANPYPGYPGPAAVPPMDAAGYPCRAFAKAELGRSSDSAGMMLGQILYDSNGDVVGNADSPSASDSYSQKKDAVNVSEVVYSVSGVVTDGSGNLASLRLRRQRDLDAGMTSAYTSVKQRYYVFLPEGLVLNEAPDPAYPHQTTSGSSPFLSASSAFYTGIANPKRVHNNYTNTLASDTNVPGFDALTSWGEAKQLYWQGYNWDPAIGDLIDGYVTLEGTYEIGSRQLAVFDRVILRDDMESWFGWTTRVWGRGFSFSAVPRDGTGTLPSGNYETLFLCQFLDGEDRPIPLEDCGGKISNTAADAFGEAVGNLVDPVLDAGDGSSLLSISAGFRNMSGSGSSSAGISVKAGKVLPDRPDAYGAEAVAEPEGTYNYALTYSVGEGSGTDVVLWDSIEDYSRNAAGSEWRGTVAGVDLNGTGAAVYVNKNPVDIDAYAGENVSREQLDDGEWRKEHGWILVGDPDAYPDWGSVRSVAFSFGSRIFSAESGGKSATVYLKMQAPGDIEKTYGQEIYTAYNEFLFSDSHMAAGSQEKKPGASLVKPAQIQLKLPAEGGYRLPDAGGIGTAPFTAAGAAAMAAALAMLAYGRRKRR